MSEQRWTLYLCQRHGPLSRTATHVAIGEPVGGELACSYCVADDPRGDAMRVRVIEVVPADRERALEEHAKRADEARHAANHRAHLSFKRERALVEALREIAAQTHLRASQEIARAALSAQEPDNSLPDGAPFPLPPTAQEPETCPSCGCARGVTGVLTRVVPGTNLPDTCRDPFHSLAAQEPSDG